MMKFKKARPVWLKGLSTEMNVTVGFRAVFHAKQQSLLRVTGATLYRITLNGSFVGHGPARCGHGHYRVDEWCLPVRQGANLLAVEAVGYNANGYGHLDQESFLQAEVEGDGRILAATGTGSFTAHRLKQRVQKSQRYSFQRAFTEVYRMTPRSSTWREKPEYRKKPDPVEILPARRLTGRGVPYPKFETRQPVARPASGTTREKKNPKLCWSREAKGPTADFKAFPADSRTAYPLHELQRLAFTMRSRKGQNYDASDSSEIRKGAFQVLDFGTNLTGFIGLHVECDEQVDLYVTFDELAMENGDVSLTRYHCANVVKYTLKPGAYDLETIEPYTLKFLKLTSLKAGCRVRGVYLREYVSPQAQRAQFAASDRKLNELFEAARQTFRQNAVDVFMDCPGRERAGWLCDSFFTARAEQDLCGSNAIERNFFENYLLPGRYRHLPKGMLPMCYPSDHNDGTFIPNWAMWFVVQLEEYLYRSGDRELVDGLRSRVYGLLKYFERFLNTEGLLESLDSWVFVEWSKANSFTQDVNYPSNMLYAGMLDAAGALYGDDKLIQQADAVREAIRRQSFDGEFFVDNAVRNDEGALAATRNRTETCQYYAFYFDVATPTSHGDLWRKLTAEFGPGRNPRRKHRQIHPSNAFIGFFLRLDILSRYGRTDLVLDQLYKTYLPMAEMTGTLWEHKDTSASCNHGFASHVAHILYRDILGVRVDPVLKTIRFRVPEVGLDWCEGRIPVGDEWIEVSWHRDGRGVRKRIAVPGGYKVIQ